MDCLSKFKKKIVVPERFNGNDVLFRAALREAGFGLHDWDKFITQNPEAGISNNNETVIELRELPLTADAAEALGFERCSYEAVLQCYLEAEIEEYPKSRWIIFATEPAVNWPTVNWEGEIKEPAVLSVVVQRNGSVNGGLWFDSTTIPAVYMKVAKL